VRIWLLAGIVAVWLAMPSCTRHTISVEPINIKIEPIEIKMEINIKIDRELDNFFAFQEDAEKKGTPNEKKTP